METLKEIKKLSASDIIDPAVLKLTSKKLGIDISMLLTWRKDYIFAKFYNNRTSMINLASSLSRKFTEQDLKTNIRSYIESKNRIELKKIYLNPDYSGFLTQGKKNEIAEEVIKLKTDMEICEAEIMADIDWIFNTHHILGKKEISYLQIANAKVVLGMIKAGEDYEDDGEDDADIEEEDL